jgi:hypothetical protein
MSGWWDQRSRLTRLLVYAVAVILMLVMAASVGAVAALVVGGNVSWPTGDRARPDGPDPAGEQYKIPQHHQDKLTQYVDGVGEIQANSVEAFLDSHEKLLRYDTLTSGDIEQMQANQAALQGFVDQASDLRAPKQYRNQKDEFVSAIHELHQAAQLAYALAADPVSATQADFDDYDRIVDEATVGLRRSNQLLGKDFKGLEGVREVSA